ncbi:SusD/RagB family nutrient-binding outer membrane lipoprotein [Bacteroidota bacterium]
MKNIKILLLGILISLAGCEDFLDINEDPNSPTSPAIDQLLPSIMYDIADDFSVAYNRLGYVTSVYTHQLTSREDIDEYGVTGSYYAISTFWQDLYQGPLMDLKVLIDLADETNNSVYEGMAKILKAYTYHMMVDLWGDIPYTEATTPGNIHPAFDDDEAIYADLFILLDSAVADLLNTSADNYNLPGGDDLIYGGDIDSWVKAANTLKLKMYNQVRLTSMYNQAAVTALLANPDTLLGPGDDFMVPFGTLNAPENRHPAFVSEYVGAQISNYISVWFFETLSGLRSDIFSGIIDPRIPYYWVNQLTGGEEPENPEEYREGDFNSIYFGSAGTNSDHAGRASFTMMGVYPCGGKYDDGNGAAPAGTLVTLGQGDATGAAPQRLITYADRLYIEAELTHANGGDARALLEQAMYESFNIVDVVVGLVGPYEGPAAILGSGSDTTYVDAVLAAFDAGTNAKKLEIIMTQKWIQSFGNGCDNYTDYRRTGYPVMFDPNANGGQHPGGSMGTDPMVPTQASRGYPLSMPYDADEITLNTSSPDQKVITTSRVFWDID